MPIFARKRAHSAGADVWRVGDDQVVARARQRRKQVGPQCAYAALQAVGCNIVPGNGQRVPVDIDGVDARRAKRLGEQDGEAAGAGAQIERAANTVAGGEPGHEPFAQQLGDERARHDHALVDIKTVIAEPRFPREVGGRNAAADALVDQAQRAAAFHRRNPAREMRRQPVWRQPERMQHQVNRLVPCIGGAMPEREPRAREARKRDVDELVYGGRRRDRPARSFGRRHGATVPARVRPCRD